MVDHCELAERRTTALDADGGFARAHQRPAIHIPGILKLPKRLLVIDDVTKIGTQLGLQKLARAWS